MNAKNVPKSSIQHATTHNWLKHGGLGEHLDILLYINKLQFCDISVAFFIRKLQEKIISL